MGDLESRINLLSGPILQKFRRCLVSISVYTVVFVCLDEEHTKTTVELTQTGDEEMVDEVTTKCLTDKKALNWCRTTSRLVALKNNSRGRSSLLKAVSKSIWAVDNRDTETFLQQLMDMNLSSARESARLKERWENETEARSNTNHSAEFSSWEEVCKAFKDDNGAWDGRTSDVDCIHIFTLANIIKRPIIILEANEDENHAENVGLSGLYLPSLIQSEHCFKSPIILASRDQRFNPVVVRSDPTDLDRKTPRIKAVPLVTHRFEQFQIRNLANEERQNQGFALIQNYMKVEEIPCTGPSAVNHVLTARLISHKPEVLDALIDRNELHPGNIPNTKFSYRQIMDDPRNSSGRGGSRDFTNLLIQNSGLKCSDPQCNQPVDPDFNPKCRMHGTLGNKPVVSSPGYNDEIFVNANTGIAQKEVNELANFGKRVAGKCVAPQCERPGAREYEGKCRLCYVMGNDFNESTETYESGGCLKSSEELAREELNRELLQNGGRKHPTHSSARKSVDEVEETKYERQMSEQPKCTAPICENVGLNTYNGLCIECFNTLWKAKESGIQQTKAIRTNIAEVSVPGWTEGSAVPTRFVASRAKCLTEGCHLPVDVQDLGLCKSCYDHQRQVQQDFERQKQMTGSRSASSGAKRQTSSAEIYGSWYSSKEPPFQGQPKPGQSKFVGQPHSPHRHGTSRYPRSDESTLAKMCLSSACDRFGDPGYKGYCSVCYVDRN